MGRCGRRTRSNAFGSPPCAALRRRVSLSATTGAGLLLARPHLTRAVRRDAQRPRGALQEQDGEARVHRAGAPGAVRGLGLDEDLRAFGVPLVLAHHLRAVQHARALEGIHVVEVLVLGVLLHLGVLVRAGVVRHGEVLPDPHQAFVDVRVVLPGALLAFVVVLDVVPDRQAADRAGRHRAVRLVIGVIAVAPALGRGLLGHAARARDRRAAAAAAALHAGLRAGHARVGAVHAAFDEVLGRFLFLLLAVAQPLHREVDDLVLKHDARVRAGARAERGVLRVGVVMAFAVAVLLHLDLVRDLRLGPHPGLGQLELLHAARLLAAARRHVLALGNVVRDVVDVDRGRAVAPETLGAL